MKVGKCLGVLAAAGCSIVAASCSQTEPRESAARSSAELTVASTPTINNFVVYAANNVTLGTATKSVGGNIGVATANGASPQLVVGNHDLLDGQHTLYSPALSIGDLAVVGAIDTNSLSNNGGTVGTEEGYPLPMPPMPSVFAAAPGTSNVIVAIGQQQTLSPGNYGTLVDNGIVFLNPGIYSFASVTLGNNAQLQALQGGSTSVLVAGTLATGTLTQILPVGQSANELTISVSGTDGANGSPPAVSIGANSQITSILAAPNGTVSFGSNVQSTGAFSGLNFTAGANVVLTFQSGFANALPSLSTFVAYAEMSVTLGSGDHSLGGDIGVAATSGSGAQLTVGAQDVLDSSHTLYAASVSLGSQSNVGDVDTTTLTNGGGAYGTLEPYPASAMPALPFAPAGTPGTQNVTVSVGQQQTLTPGSYGTLTDNGIVLLNPGTYSFAGVALGNNAQLQALQGGATSIVVSSNLSTGTLAEILPVAQSAGNLSISVLGNDGANGTPPAASLGANAQIVALLSVPHGTLSLGNNVLATGAFSGFSISAGTGVSLTFQSGFPSTPPPSAGIQQLSGYFTGTVLSTAPILGPVPQSMPITVTVGLPVASLSNLQAFVESVSDPASSSYGQYVPPQNFAGMFGLSSTAYGDLQTWAQGQGLTVSGQYANDMVMDLTGTAATIEQALNVNLFYRARVDGSAFYALDREPSLSLPPQQAQILYIEGLQNYELPQPGLTSAGSCGGPAPFGPCLIGNDFRDAYACTNLFGAQQSIGIWNWPGTHFYKYDFDQYRAAAGNASLTPEVIAVSVDGAQTSSLTYPGANLQNQAACYGTGNKINCGPAPKTCPSCPSSQICQNGTCICPSGGTLCGGQCTDSAADPSNCGGCGKTCKVGQFCSQGTCIASCPSSLSTPCSNGCVNTNNDPLNCGSCGTVCPANSACKSGTCKCSTGVSPQQCNGTCTDTNSDPMNCGGCSGMSSTATVTSASTFSNICSGSTPVCSNGTCQAACPSGQSSCSGGQGTFFSTGIGTVCPSSYTQCSSPNSNICCPNGFVCGNGNNCPLGTCCESSAEDELDVQAASAMAPSAQIYSFQGPTYDSMFAAMATYKPQNTPLINQLSVSYTFCADPVAQQLLYQMAAQGQSIFISSGDNGGQQAPGTPGFFNKVCNRIGLQLIDDRELDAATIVGGTILTLNTATNPESWSSETAWDFTNAGTASGNKFFASSGAICPDTAIPFYQTAAMAKSPNPQASTTNRNMPDVSMPAFDTAVWVSGGVGGAPGWYVGTSIATPLWAAYTALVNGQLQTQTKPTVPTVGFLNPAIYAIGSTFNTSGGVPSTADCNESQAAAAGSPYYADFHDINDCTPNTGVGPSFANACNAPAGGAPSTGANCGFTALPGYDLVTGWGSPTCHLTQDLACPTTCGCKVGGNVKVCPCPDLDTDSNNCGACNNKCSQGLAPCVGGQCQPLALASNLGPSLAFAVDGTNVYVSTSAGTIVGIPVVSSSQTTLPTPTTFVTLSSGNYASDVAVDPTSNNNDSSFIYYTDNSNPGTGTIDTSGVFTAFKPNSGLSGSGVDGTSGAVGAIAAYNGILFWLQTPGNPTSGPVGVFDLSGEIASAQQPFAITADANNVYWSDSQDNSVGLTNGIVMQAPVGGGTSITLSTEQDFVVLGLFADSKNLYWDDFGSTVTQLLNAIVQAPINGGAVTTLVSPSYFTNAGVATTSNPVSDGVNVYFGVEGSVAGSPGGGTSGVVDFSSIWTVPVNGGTVTVYASNPQGATSTGVSAGELAIDSKNVYWLDPSGSVFQYPRLH
jgi:hypothetical protein